MKVLELFAGSRSIGKVAESRGHEVCSVDINAFENIDIVGDVEDLTIDMLPWIPDIIWSGTPCTTYSIASVSTHRNHDLTGKTEFAQKCDRMNVHVMAMIQECMDRNPHLLWYIENPRGMLRKMPFMRGLPRTTVWYCRYGAKNAKPTDVWSNNLFSLFNQDGWNPRPMCFNGNTKCHHEDAPRGSKTGTQGLKDAYERSKYPEELCIEIIEASEKKLQKK